MIVSQKIRYIAIIYRQNIYSKEEKQVVNFSIRALLVEDNLVAQMAAKSTLQDLGCSVDVTSTGKEAKQLAASNLYDIIFMDVGLGDIDGFWVAKEIKEGKGLNRLTPIIALTAHDIDEYERHGAGNGMTDFIAKPITPEKVISVLSAVCR